MLAMAAVVSFSLPGEMKLQPSSTLQYNVECIPPQLLPPYAYPRAWLVPTL
jgi:hypothetical protein